MASPCVILSYDKLTHYLTQIYFKYGKPVCLNQILIMTSSHTNELHYGQVNHGYFIRYVQMQKDHIGCKVTTSICFIKNLLHSNGFITNES